jgi:DnaJ-class molecular chaperone
MSDTDRKNPGDEDAPGAKQTGENICPTCSGSGRLGEKPCPDCGGSGQITAIVGDA